MDSIRRLRNSLSGACLPEFVTALDDALSTGPCTIVATQTLEVGVDLSFDALITESCSWSALVQRLGRLNRDGRSQSGTAEIVCGSDSRGGSVARRGTQAVYGEGVAERVTELLRRLEHEQGGAVDLGYSGLRQIEQHEAFDPSALDRAPSRVCTLHSAMLPLLAQTRPTPSPDFPLHSLITGPDAQAAPEVDVAWRTDLSIFDAVDGARVSPAEFVTVPRPALLAFLREDHRAVTAFGDAGPAASETATQHWDARFSLADFRVWDQDSAKWRRPRGPADVEQTPRLIMSPALRGYDGELGWTGLHGEDQPTPDDLSLLLPMRSFSTDAAVAGSVPLPDLVLSRASLAACCAAGDPGGGVPAPQPNSEVVLHGELIDDLLAELSRVERLRQQGVPGEDIETDLEEIGEGIVEQLLQPVSDASLSAAVTAAIGDTAAVHIRFEQVPASRKDGAVLLDDHQRQVATLAYADAQHAGLPDDLATAAAAGGRLHDEGKHDDRMQQFFTGTAEPSAAPLAKSRSGLYSGPGGLCRERNTRTALGLTDGWRHEAESLALVGSYLSPLIRHLIVSHHGWGRPLLPPAHPLPQSGYPGPLDRAEEFDRLNRQHGPWGLAYLEAVLRLADWRASSAPRSDVDPTDPHLPIAVRNTAQRRVQQESTASTAADPHPGGRLSGLHTHPLTAWFASVGLLAAAHEAGDASARLHWEPWTNGAETPVVPVLQSTIPAAELIRRIMNSDEWERAEHLARAVGFSNGLGVKNQRLQPASALGDLLRQAEDQDLALILGIVGDLGMATAEGTADLPLPAIANNSSYIGVALAAITGGDRAARTAAAAEAALRSVDAGYASVKCDGGMDRSTAELPGVNGLGDARNRQSRSALAPLAVFGMSHVGAGTPSGVGVLRRDLVLPLPTVPVHFAELRALALMGRGDSVPGRWKPYGLGWIYTAIRERPTKYEKVWAGRAEPRKAPALLDGGHRRPRQ